MEGQIRTLDYAIHCKKAGRRLLEPAGSGSFCLCINNTFFNCQFGSETLAFLANPDWGLCDRRFAFMVFKSILYKPRYELHFLPNLNNAVQRLSGEAKDAISKAKSGQYKTFTLLLIQCVFQKLSGCSKLSEGNIQRELLCKQYGISNDTLDAPLKNLLSKSYKEQHPKMQTQILDYFEEAKMYFDSLDCKPATALLEEMQRSIEQGKKLPF